MSWAHAAPGVQPNAVARTSGYRQAEHAAAGHQQINPVTQSAYDLLHQTLRQWGLGVLYNVALGYLKSGIAQDPNALQLELQNTKEWKQRFAGNELRKANGLAELSPGDYLSLERSYQDVLRNYGMPRGFYDQHSDFAKMIGNDISPAELDARAKIAHDQYTAAPSYMKSLWSQYFGLTPGHAIAAILDPKTATQLIQDKSTQIGIGAAAASQHLAVDQPRAQQLQRAGVTAQQAQQGFSQIAQAMPTDQMIAQRFGTTFSQHDEENDVLLQQAAAGKKRQTLYGEESGLFNERASNDANSIGVSQTY